MAALIDLTTLDLRFQDYRMRDDAREARLRASIAERGIEEPLEGIDLIDDEDGEDPRDDATANQDNGCVDPAKHAADDGISAVGSPTAVGESVASDRPWGTESSATPNKIRHVLLNGFQRYRCAKKLRIHEVPYIALAHDEAAGIIQLLRVAKQQRLGILEEAKFIDELMTIHDQSLTDVAEALSRSKGWVSMRRGLLQEMSPVVQAILFRGTFPVYAYLYSLRPFMRMNGVSAKQIERFMQATAGHRLSVRDVDWLAEGYFRGPVSLRQAIDEGQVRWSLEQMKQVPAHPDGFSEFQRELLRDLQQLRKLQLRVLARIDRTGDDTGLTHRAFLAEAHLAVSGLLIECDSFFQKVRAFTCPMVERIRSLQSYVPRES
jgi:hypothetical protein